MEEEQSVQSPEGTFFIVWHQHNSDDWIAEVTDTRTGQKRSVYTVAELAHFVHSQLRREATPSAET